MSFIQLVKYFMMMKRCGYWCIRMQMLKEGATLNEVGIVLGWRLRSLGKMNATTS